MLKACALNPDSSSQEKEYNIIHVDPSETKGDSSWMISQGAMFCFCLEPYYRAVNTQRNISELDCDVKGM